MSSLGIANNLYSLLSSFGTSGSSSSGLSGNSLPGTASSADFSTSLAVRMASLQAQSVNLLIGAANRGNSQGNSASGLDFLLGNNTSPASASNDLRSLFGLSSATQGLSATGRKLSLFDPESAYNMMSIINKDDVSYKAQFAELSEMKAAVAEMQAAGTTLGSIDASLDDAAIVSRMQEFVGKYNEWIKRFDGTVKSDGILAGTQAAEISLYELEQSIENPFNGAKDGFRGLSDLGLRIDEHSNLASLDTNALTSALANNRSGVLNAVHEFSANFAKSAELLNSANNFIPNRLANLDRVIDYITANKTSLQTEFGLGAPAKISEQIAKALARYEQIAAI